MEKENKIGTYSFVAEPFHVDFSGKLKADDERAGESPAELCRVSCGRT